MAIIIIKQRQSDNVRNATANASDALALPIFASNAIRITTCIRQPAMRAVLKTSKKIV